MNHLSDALEALASPESGPPPRGAADVLAGARTVARRRRQRRRAGLTALGAAAVGAVVFGLGSLTGGDDGAVETEGSPATDPSPTAPVTTRPPVDTTAPGSTTTAAPPTTDAIPDADPTPADGEPAGDGTGSGDAATGGRPGPTTTGPDGTTLTRMTPAEVEALMRPGAVIEDVLIAGGNLDVVADDVTLRNFRLEGGGAPYGIRSVDGHTGFTAEDGEILDVTSAAFYGSHATLRRLDVHDSDNAAFKLLTGVTVEASWWHHLGRGGGSGLGAQFEDDRGGTNALVGNHCELPAGPAGPPGYDADACVQVDGAAPWSITIEGNWFDGGDNTVDCGGAPGVTLRANRFGRRLAGQPVIRCPAASANVWDDTGAPIP
ncbi:MAG TPA: hypothetical protein VIL36_23135 [Acidimicrobiales bacterium]